MDNYISKAVTTKISAKSSTTLQIKNNFYKVEFFEEREIPLDEDVDLDAERDLLFDAVNAVVDKQSEDILTTFS